MNIAATYLEDRGLKALTNTILGVLHCSLSVTYIKERAWAFLYAAGKYKEVTVRNITIQGGDYYRWLAPLLLEQMTEAVK